MIRALALAVALVGVPIAAFGQTCGTRCMQLEAQIQSALTTSGLTNVMARAERSDGHVLEVSVGTPNVRYISSSTAKPPAVSVILGVVADGFVSLDTLVVDVLPGFSANATQAHRRISLRHLVTFTSGMIHGPKGPGSVACSQQATSQAAFSDCIDRMPLGNNPTTEPGVRMIYSSWQLALAGQVAVVASGHPTWASLFDAWRTRTGLFAGATWNTNFWFAADRQFNITAAEYAGYLRALQDCTILTPRLCVLQQSDQMPWAVSVSPTHTAWGLGEDWHFAAGIWAECRSSVHDCVDHPRVSSIGVGGQYAYFDRETGHRFVVSATFRGLATGFQFARSIDHLLVEWARTDD